MTTDPTSAAAEDRPAAVRIALAFGSMPYGAAARFRTFAVVAEADPGPLLEVIAENLENLRAALAAHAAADTARDAEANLLARLLASAESLDDLVAQARAERAASERAALAQLADTGAGGLAFTVTIRGRTAGPVADVDLLDAAHAALVQLDEPEHFATLDVSLDVKFDRSTNPS